MSDPERDELLKIYLLHVELADRVSQRREGANRLYVTLLAAMAAFLGALFRYGIDDAAVEIVMGAASLVGVLLAASWYVVIRSYRQLNSGKFKALHELEEKLAYPFFKREWELLEEGKNMSRYWRLTVVETALPGIFVGLFFAVLLFLAFR